MEHAIILSCLNGSFNDTENITKLNIQRDIKKRENDVKQKEEEENRILRLRQIEIEEKERRERAKRDREIEEKKRKELEEKLNFEEKKRAADLRQIEEERLKFELEKAKKKEEEEEQKRKANEREELIAKLQRDQIENERVIHEMATMKSKILNFKMQQVNEKEAELNNMVWILFVIY